MGLVYLIGRWTGRWFYVAGILGLATFLVGALVLVVIVGDGILAGCLPCRSFAF